MKVFVAVVDYGRTVQSDIYIGHNFIIANFRLRCSQHWETLPLIIHHLVGHLHTHTHRNLMLISTHNVQMDSSNFHGVEEHLNTR